MTSAAKTKKKILLIAANAATSPTTGWPVGFWWAELTHPYVAFSEAGYDVEIRSPDGGALRTSSSASGSRSHAHISRNWRRPRASIRSTSASTMPCS